jgi:hypothetical protein
MITPVMSSEELAALITAAFVIFYARRPLVALGPGRVGPGDNQIRRFFVRG